MLMSVSRVHVECDALLLSWEFVTMELWRCSHPAGAKRDCSSSLWTKFVPRITSIDSLWWDNRRRDGWSETVTLTVFIVQPPLCIACLSLGLRMTEAAVHCAQQLFYIQSMIATQHFLFKGAHFITKLIIKDISNFSNYPLFHDIYLIPS